MAIKARSPLLQEKDEEEVLFCAFRYGLGRMTYITGFLADVIVEAWPRLSERMKNQILEEIHKGISEDRLGMDMDKRQWLRIVERASGER